MPTPTVATRPDAPPLDYDMVADVIARMLATADHVRAELATDGIGALFLFLADAHLLGRTIDDGCDLEEIAGRLWMVAR